MATNKENNNFTRFELFVVVFHAVIGIGLLTLPRTAALDAGPNGWLGVLLAGLIPFLGIFPIYALAERFPTAGLVPIAERVMGRVLGRLLTGLYLVYLLLIIATVTRSFADLITVWLLPNTPKEVVIAITLLLCSYFIWQDFRTFIRAEEIFFLLILYLYIFLFLPLSEAHIGFLLPIGAASAKEIAHCMINSLFAYAGYEIVLVLFPYWPPGRRQRLYPVLWALLWITLTYTATTAVTISVLSAPELKWQMWPVISMVKSIRGFGGVFDRLESTFVASWVMVAITLLAVQGYALTIVLHQWVGRKTRTFYILPSAIVVFALALLPHSIADVMLLSDWLSKAGLAVQIGIPCLLLLVAVWRRVKLEAPHETS